MNTVPKSNRFRFRISVLILLSLWMTGTAAVTDNNITDNISVGHATATLYVPPGDAILPAVVLMHGCSGLTPAVRAGLTELAIFLTTRDISR